MQEVKPKNKTPVVSSDSAVLDLIKTLGLDDRMITELKINLLAGHIAEVGCKFYLSLEDLENITTVCKKYKLTPIENNQGVQNGS